MLRARHKDQLSFDRAALHAGQGLGGSVERQHGVQVRRELAFFDPGEHAGGVGAVALRLQHGELPPEHANDLAALEQRQVERDLGDLAGGKADHQVAAFHR